MAHPYRDPGAAPRSPRARRARESEPEDLLSMSYDEAANVGDVEDERPGLMPWYVASLAAVGTVLIVLAVLEKGHRTNAAPVVASQSDVVDRLGGVVVARSGNIATQVGERCSVDIADVEEGGRECHLHVLCGGREQGFIAARCPLDPGAPITGRRLLTYEAFDGDGRSLGAATLELDAK